MDKSSIMMIMKKFRFLLVAIANVLLFSSCQSDDTFTIKGTILNPGNQKVIALYEGERKLDSAFLNEQGAFVLKRSAEQPRLFYAMIGGKRFPVIIKNGQTLQLEADLQQEYAYSVSGNDLSLRLQDFAKVHNDMIRFRDSLEETFFTRSLGLVEPELSSVRSSFQMQERNYMEKYEQKAIEFASQQEDLAGFFAMSTLVPAYSEAAIIAYSESLGDLFNENALVRDFKENAIKLKRLAIGQPAPDFESFTFTNRSVKLSDYKGKITLIDFWASWCPPCREENPNLVRLYRQYKDKGFDIFGVSLDNNPGAWKRAMDSDELVWTNVSDLQAWGGEVVELYRLTSIPVSYVLDRDGIIIAKNLRGEELADFLATIMN
jgi:peroxiredoxin